MDNQEGDGKKPAEASSRRYSQPILSVGSHDPVAATSGDQLAVELAAEFGLSSKQRQRIKEYFEFTGLKYPKTNTKACLLFAGAVLIPILIALSLPRSRTSHAIADDPQYVPGQYSTPHTSMSQ